MNIEKLKDAEGIFMMRYPGGFENPEMMEIAKKHKLGVIEKFAKESFTKSSFKNRGDVVESYIKLIAKSTMVSLFEKPKFRDGVHSMTMEEKEELSNGMYELLYGDEKAGFEKVVKVLSYYKLAKWTVVSCLLYYMDPTYQVFVKPTTVKNIIKYFELDELKYDAKPTYEFYSKLREIINDMKKHVDMSVCPNNAAFTGFMMIVME